MRSGQKIQCGVPLDITTLVTSTSSLTHHHRVLPIMCLVAQSSEGASSFECEPWALASPLNARSPAAKPNSLVTIVYRNKRDSFKKTKTADRSTALERSMVSRRYGGLSSFAMFAPITRAFAELQPFFQGCSIACYPIYFHTPTRDGAPGGVQLIICLPYYLLEHIAR